MSRARLPMGPRTTHLHAALLQRSADTAARRDAVCWKLDSYVLLTCFRVLSPMARSAAALSKIRCLRSVYGTSCRENLHSS